MSDDEIRYSSISRSTAVSGRTITSARNNHVVIDSPSGPNEAMTTGEAFAAGIAACGVTLVQTIAKERGITVGPLSCEIAVVRRKSKPEDISRLEVTYVFDQLDRRQATELVEGWRSR